MFDSGVGGLNILRALMEREPRGKYVYLADQRCFPYGTRELSFLKERIGAVLELLRPAGTVVIACNTASSVYALGDMQLPNVLEIIALTCARALASSRSGRIGVIATDMTVRLGRYDAMLRRAGADSLSVGCSELVGLIESGAGLAEPIYKAALSAALERLLAPFLRHRIDTLICGCTHFGYILNEIRAQLGDIAYIVSDGAAADFMMSAGRLLPHPEPDCRIYTTRSSLEFDEKMRLFGYNERSHHIDF